MQLRGTESFNPTTVYIHSDTLKALSKKAKTEVMWPRAYGKTHAFKTFFGMDIATNDSISVNQFVFKDSKGNIQIITGEEDMCYDRCAPEGAAPDTDYLREQVREMQRNHLGASTERFIEMARELGRNDHLRELTGELHSQLHDARYEAKRMAEQAAYSDNETQKANKRVEAWTQRAVKAENLYYGLREKNRKAKAATKKPAKKTSK